jgi:hypothetical protein
MSQVANSTSQISYVELESTLSKYEKMLWDVTKSRGAVPLLLGSPGTGKSAIFKTIADKLGLQYIDLRLSTLDETDLGIFPSKEIYTDENGKTHKYVEHLYPHWAVISNEKPTLIHFEEINRTTNAKRNACLQILNEKTMGYSFKFNDNVFFVSSGNLGIADGTEVDELENAILNRFAIFEHRMTYDYWYENYGKKNVNPIITSFLKDNTEEFNMPVRSRSSESTMSVYAGCFPSPRSWDNFSKYIKSNNVDLYKKDELNDVRVILNGFVGTIASEKFYNYVKDRNRVTLHNIIDEYDKYETEIEQLDRVQREGIFSDISKRKLFSDEFSDKQYKNIKRFINSCLNTNLNEDMFLDGVAGHIYNMLINVDVDIVIANTFDGDVSDDIKKFSKRRVDFIKSFDHIISEIEEETEKNEQ